MLYLGTYRDFRKPPSLSLLKNGPMLTLLCSDSLTHQKRMNGGLTLKDENGETAFQGYKIVKGDNLQSLFVYKPDMYIYNIRNHIIDVYPCFN